MLATFISKLLQLCLQQFSLCLLKWKATGMATVTANKLGHIWGLSLSHSRSGGTCHRLNRLQEAHHASWVGRVDVVGGGACLHVSWTAQEQMLCCLVVASAVWT